MDINQKLVEEETKLKQNVELYQQLQKQMQDLGNDIIAGQGAVKALKEVLSSKEVTK
jgi:hypothetical protein